MKLVSLILVGVGVYLVIDGNNWGYLFGIPGIIFWPRQPKPNQSLWQQFVIPELEEDWAVILKKEFGWDWSVMEQIGANQDMISAVKRRLEIEEEKEYKREMLKHRQEMEKIRRTVNGTNSHKKYSRSYLEDGDYFDEFEDGDFFEEDEREIEEIRRTAYKMTIHKKYSRSYLEDDDFFEEDERERTEKEAEKRKRKQAEVRTSVGIYSDTRIYNRNEIVFIDEGGESTNYLALVSGIKGLHPHDHPDVWKVYSQKYKTPSWIKTEKTNQEIQLNTEEIENE